MPFPVEKDQSTGEPPPDLYRYEVAARGVDKLEDLEEGHIQFFHEQLMGENPVLFQEMALLKPPHIGREKPWHQDCAYFDLPLETSVVAIWIALEEATPENGCLHLIPGSHRSGPMPHFKRRDWQICDTDVAVDRGVMVPLKPGGCLFWHGLLHHGSPANHSSLSRRALQYHYKPASAEESSKEERLQLFGGEVAGAQC